MRDKMISDLSRLTGIPIDVLKSMSDEQLEKIYAERVLEKGMI